MFFGGRVAEELACKDISAGAKDDIKKATELARMMVCEWGMSETLGPINYSESEEHLFLGREITRSRNHSEFTAQEIDKEVRRILDEGYNKAKDLILQNIDKLEKLAKALLKYETLTGAQVKKIIKGEDIERPNETPVSHPEIGKPVEEKQVSPKPLRGEEPITGPAQA
jgi:cell division protease FtsH